MSFSLSDPVVWVFPALASASLVGLPLYAWRVRGRRYALFALVILLFALPGAVAVHLRAFGWLPAPLDRASGWAFAAGMVAATLHLGHLVRARLRSRSFRALVSIPGQVFVAAGFLSTLWLLLLVPVRGVLWLFGLDGVLDTLRPLDVLPALVAVGSVATSIGGRPEVVRIRLAKDGPAETTRAPVERVHPARHVPGEERPLRLVQISDPHLGPWQSVRRLRERVARLVAEDPDLVLLTGDFLTMEGQGSEGALAEALSPLQAIAERCYAVFGNHDHEAPEVVRHALAANDIRLLVDEEALADTPLGPVQILGADWRGSERRKHLAGLFAAHPRRPGHLRLLLLHDPLGFHGIPDGEVDLTLSGHTHGGQIGLVSLGRDWTVLSRSPWPDHGLFAKGANRLYVHRGTGFYGFPLRIGVPGELSVLEVLPAAAP